MGRGDGMDDDRAVVDVVYSDTDSDDCEGGVWQRPVKPAPAAHHHSNSEKSPLLADSSVNGSSSAGSGDKAAPTQVEKKNVVVAILTLLLSIPALLGTWCWPVLVAGLLGVAASAGAKAFTHSITFGITLAALSNIAQYVFHKRSGIARVEKRKREKNEVRGTNVPTLGHFAVWGAFYLTALSVPLVMADLTRHVLQDSNYWPSACPYNTEKDCVKAGGTCFWTTHDTAPPGECVNSDFWKPGSSMYYGADDKLSIIGVIFTVIFTWSGYIALIVGVIWSANIHLKLKEIRDQYRELRSGNSQPQN